MPNTVTGENVPKKNSVKPRTPAAQESANTPPKPGKTIVLSDGRIASFIPLKGKHIRIAGRLVDGDQSKILFAMAATGSLIDGKPFTIEELDEMDAKDVIEITNEFAHLFT